jgi:serine protease Do
MYELEPRRRILGVAPYLFGAITGVAIGLAVIAGVVFWKSSGNGSSRAASSGSSGLGAGYVQTDYKPASQGSIDTSRRNAIVQATELVAPAVVNVTVVRTETYRTSPWFLDDLFKRNWPVRKRKVGGYGSGFIIRAEGYIITNEHVVRGAEDIWITLPNGEDMQAEVVGSARRYDLALLKVQKERLPYAQLGDSDGLMVGEWVIAIGSPFGHLLADPHPTVTVGVVSAFHRDVKAEVSNEQILKDLIQTDAAINPGNSGGPLVNSRGEVIGINAAIFSRSGGSEGIGFAIPVNRARWVMDEILTYGRVRDVYMGMTGMDITPAVAAAMNLDNGRGVLVQGIYEDGPAYNAGIRAGDLLISINGIEVRDIDHVNHIVFPARVDDRLVIEIERKGDRKTVTLALEERPDDI